MGLIMNRPRKDNFGFLLLFNEPNISQSYVTMRVNFSFSEAKKAD